MIDEFLAAAIAEAEQGLREGGIPIGSVIVSQGKIIGRGHNRRVQKGSAVLHGAPFLHSAIVTATDERSEEHTSELQSRSDLVCRLLLEKKKDNCRTYSFT